ncbi:hypothetical protein GOODEAATRI_032861 [Goodea atripinnis]|uniref:Uncharacterized protein n=1 Tax=Goodea atripinnis TaxID=208336 RepID=A0ABV0P1I1_9TELE
MDDFTSAALRRGYLGALFLALRGSLFIYCHFKPFLESSVCHYIFILMTFKSISLENMAVLFHPLILSSTSMDGWYQISIILIKKKTAGHPLLNPVAPAVSPR